MADQMNAAWTMADAAVVAGSLDADEVHAWLIDLDAPAPGDRPPTEYLSDDEHARAARFRFDDHRRRFATARGLMRWLLAHYTGSDPAALRFGHGPAGKPALLAAPAAADLAFNLSHSGGHALLGVARGMALGVDIESVRAVPDSASIASSLFATAEVQALQALPLPRRSEGFFACWTRKEAYVKALGGGLSVPLDGFEVSVDPDAPAALRSIGGSPGAAAGWTLWGERLGCGAWCAVAVDRRPARLRRIMLN